MRVTCNTVDEFVECLKNEKDLFQDTIRVSVSKTPVDGNSRSATKFEVLFQASAVVYVDEEGQFLLEVGKNCGVDIRDADPSEDGSRMAEALKQIVSSYAAERGWKVLPGSIQI